MGGHHRFWVFFGGIWLTVGSMWLASSIVALLFFDGAGKPPEVLATFAGVGFALTAIGGFLAGRAIRQSRRDRRLAEAGIKLRATVQEIRRSRLGINREPRWFVHYSYTYGAGRTHLGRSAPLPTELAQRWHPGDTASIMVDPRRPEESVWLGTSD